MIDKAVIKSRKKRDCKVAGMAEKTIFNAMEMCVVEAQDRPIRLTVLVNIRSVTENTMDKKVVSGHMQRAVMRTVAHPIIIEAVSDALSKIDDLMIPIAAFVWSYVEKESSRVMKKEDLARSKRNIRMLPHSSPISVCRTMTKFRSRRKKLTRMS